MEMAGRTMDDKKTMKNHIFTITTNESERKEQKQNSSISRRRVERREAILQGTQPPEGNWGRHFAGSGPVSPSRELLLLLPLMLKSLVFFRKRLFNPRLG